MGDRERIDLAGRWELAFDPDNRGKAEGWADDRFPADATTVAVPSVWNVVRPGYEGVAFYRRRFHVPATWRGRSIRLLTAAANYYAEFWVNGRYAGAHEGGYTPFELPVAALLNYGSDNVLVARVVDLPLAGEVDGFRLVEVPCAKETWYYRYGGLWGSVELEAGGPVRCTDLFVCPDLAGRPAATVQATLANEKAVDASVLIRLLVVDEDGLAQASAEQELVLRSGETVVILPLDLSRTVPWSPAQPRLYRCRCTLLDPTSAVLLDARTIAFGRRTFDVVGGEFRLNGAPIILKGVLYQPSYPCTLVYPPSLDIVERELRTIKKAGFNFVRFHLRPPHPRYLDLADHLGLLVYEETALAWIAPGPHLAERCQREVRETIRRDRNHPCVVLWGIFNENQAAARAVGRELLTYARQLDPCRPVIDNSGGAAAIDQGGSWSDFTHVLPVASPQPLPLTDLHLYFGAPVVAPVYNWLRRAGSRRRSGSLTGLGYGTPAIMRALRQRLPRDGRVFVSELGYGGLPDLAAVAAAFGEDSPLVDAVEVRAYRDSLQEGIVARGLDRIFGGMAGVVAATQELQARGDVRQVSALRSNPQVSGYVVTQFNDAAWEFHAGLVDLWRRPKRVLAALAVANQPRRLILTLLRGALAVGEPVWVEATFIDEEPPLGRAQLRLELIDPDGTRREARTLATHAKSRITTLPAVTLAGLPQPGDYLVRASLWQDGSEVASAEETVKALAAVDWGALRSTLCSRVALARPDTRMSRVCGELPVGLIPDRPLLFASRPAALASADWDALADWVRKGGRAVIGALTPQSARRLSRAIKLGLAVQASPSIGNFVGCFHYVRRSTLFEGLPADCLIGEPYASVAPCYSLSELGGAVYAGAFTSTRDTGGRPGFVWWADVQSVPLGQGQLLFCQYRIVEQLGRDPIANLLLRNVLLS